MIEIKNIKKENFWYVIGYIATDGYLSKDGRHIDITSKDRSHLFFIRKALKIDVAIGRKRRGKFQEKKFSRLQFGDVKFYHFLKHIGFVQNKTFSLGPLRIAKNYFSDFLRGVIDGDGCIYSWIHKTNRHRQ